MDGNLLKIRKLKYRALHNLVGRAVPVESLSTVEQTVLRALIPAWATGFTLDTSERDIAICIGKHGALDLTFVAFGNRLLSDSDVVTLGLLREFGLFDEEQKKAGLELGSKDPTGAKDVAETLNDAKVYFVVSLTSKQPMEAIRELLSEVAREQASRGVSSESALDAVLLRRVQTAASQFPRTFIVEEAFLTNSDSIHLRKCFYM
jgi:hypothetical protein